MSYGIFKLRIQNTGMTHRKAFCVMSPDPVGRTQAQAHGRLSEPEHLLHSQTQPQTPIILSYRRKWPFSNFSIAMNRFIH